ncbi:MAG: CSLREA domain-containing protein, partial [Armatimonadota bacterium]|nr:CSLREA domain-containing protein [Armatimonadota bacterium]
LGGVAHAIDNSFEVTSTADTDDSACDAECTLREAINAANTAGGAITFADNVTGTIQLDSALPDLDNDITITGPGANVLTVRGQGDVFEGPPFPWYRIFNVTAGKTDSISGLTISNGKAAGANGNGGNPPQNGTAGQGGGILNAGTLTVTECAFTNNTALGGAGGNGAQNVGKTGGTGGDGRGGAISSSGPALTIVRCTFSSNTAQGGDGGTGSNSNTFSLCGPGGPGGFARGGAIYIAGAGTHSIENSTFYANGSTGGAGGYGGATSFPNAKAGGRGGDGDGGGIYSAQALSLDSCTFNLCSANAGDGGNGGFLFGTPRPAGDAHGGGLNANGTITLGNTLVAGNTESNPGAGALQGPDVFGTFTSQNFNLIGILTADATGFNGAADQTGTTESPLDARLDPNGVQDNGGPTKTVQLKKGSPALDKGNTALTVDQRGDTRPQDLSDAAYPNGNGDGSDIGAFEVQALPNDAPKVASPQTVTGTAGTALSEQQVTGSDADNDTLTFSLVSGTMPDGLTLNSDGTVTGTPTTPGQTTVTFKANDGMADSNTATLKIDITEAPLLVVDTDIDNSTLYDGLTSLREAINTATSDDASTPVTFNPTFFATAKTIALRSSNGPLTTFSDLDVNGPAAGVTVSGGNSMMIMQINGGTVNLKNLTLANGRVPFFGSGAAVNIYSFGNAVVTLTGCTLKDNGGDETHGGAISNTAGTLTLINCTLSGNHADDSGQELGFASGGAFYQIYGTTTLLHCTLSGNHANGGTGGAIANDMSSTLTLHNTIVAGNTAATGPNIAGAVVASSSYNLIGDGTGMTGITNGSQGNQVGVANAGLDPNGLQNNGGPTPTIKLLAGSPAMNAGDPNFTPPPANDQRGPGFPRVVNGRLDIGAYEVGLFELPGMLQFSSATYAVNEGDGTATITVKRVGGKKGPVVVRATTGNGTATAGTLLQSGDYAATYPSLRWAHGDMADKSFTVPIVNDSTDENDETVNLALLNPSGGATLGSPSTAVLTIVDDDAGGPDLLIRRESELDAAYALDNEYQSTPSGAQIKAQQTEPGVAASYRVRVQNDGTLNRSFVLKAVESGSGFTTIYRTGPNATDITAAITSPSGYTLAPLSPNLIASATIYVTVIPLRSQAPGAEHLSTINVYENSSDTTVRDAVQTKTTVRPTADLLIKLSSEAASAFQIDNTYQTVASGLQVRTANAPPGSTLSYDVQVQ